MKNLIGAALLSFVFQKKAKKWGEIFLPSTNQHNLSLSFSLSFSLTYLFSFSRARDFSLSPSLDT
jgi:hypothetical protein